MTKYLVTYVAKGALMVEDDDPVKAKDRVRNVVAEFPGGMETDITVHFLEELE